MDDALGMRVGECPGHVAQNALCFLLRYGPGLHPLPQRCAGDIRHRIERKTVDVARGEERHDMRMLQPRRELDLALETLGGHSGAKLRRQYLDDDAPAESLLLGQKHARHPAAAQLPLDHVSVGQRR